MPASQPWYRIHYAHNQSIFRIQKYGVHTGKSFIVLLSHLALLLGSLVLSSRHFLVFIVAAVLGSIVHLGITATAAAGLVFRVEFFSNVRIGVGLEIFVNRFFVLVGRAAVWASAFIAGALVVVQGGGNKGRRMLDTQVSLFT